MRRLASALWFACGAAAAAPPASQPLALPEPPAAQLAQRLGEQVPLEVAVRDEDGVSRRLADFVDGHRPVLLVPGYYRCPRLCGLVMRGLLEALAGSGASRSQWRIVGIGIDPSETAADARARRALDLAYAASLEGGAVAPVDLHLLTLDPDVRLRLLRATGMQATGPTPDSGAWTHPATVVLLSPGGRISRYFNGIAVDPGELRVGLADAAGDRLGSVTARLAVACGRFDPIMGRLDRPVMEAVRAVSALVLVGLAAWCWRRRAPPRAHQRPGTRS